MPIDDEPTIFQQAQPKLLGLAYRILGSLADAEDAVQDTFIKWTTANQTDINNPTSWLMTVCTRRCLDMMRSASQTRVNYVGAWLPEPIHTPAGDSAADKLELASSLTTAFLLVLERLSPKERAAYLLHEIFDVSYREVSKTLDLQETACRKLVSRAKSHIDQANVRHTTPASQQNQFLCAFKQAITEGDISPLSILLSDDVNLSADSGGKVSAPRDVIQGKEKVLRFLSKRLSKYWKGFSWLSIEMNNTHGFILKDNNATIATVSFAYNETGETNQIYIMRNPDKVNHLNPVNIH